MSFNIAASIDITQGLYYIDWELEEARLDGATDDLYDPPNRTLVEVYPRLKATFTIEAIPVIEIGRTSRPI